MGSDYEYDSSSSAGSFKHGKDKKKDKKDKDKKDKGKDKDKKDDKHKEKEGKEKDKDKKKDKDKDEKDKGKDKDKKDKDKDKKDKKDKKDEYHPAAGSSSSPGGSNLYNAGVAGISASLASFGLGSSAATGGGPKAPSTGHHGGGYDTTSYHAAAPAVPVPTVPSFPPSTTTTPSAYPQQPARMSFNEPPSYGEQQSIPPSGYRVPLDSSDGSPFPKDFQQTGPPVAQDLDGSPIFIGSALFDNAVHPSKIGPHLDPPCQVAYGGGELGHRGRYDLLPFDANSMEWVHAEYGRVPQGRRPVEGGYEDGGKLYHALAYIDGVQVPGKTGEHLGGANVGFGGAEHSVQSGYQILVWRF